MGLMLVLKKAHWTAVLAGGLGVSMEGVVMGVRS
jgi:hypothetical protein